MYQLTDTTAIRRLSDGAIIPADPLNMDYAAYLDWLAEGNTPIPATGPTRAELLARIEEQVEYRLTMLAASWGYVSPDRISGYVTSSVPQWAADAQAFIAYRDACWSYALAWRKQADAGTVPVNEESIASFWAAFPATPSKPVMTE